MNNKEFGNFISSQNLKESTKELIERTEEIIGAGGEIVSSVFFGLPSYSLLKPFVESLKDWKSRVELKQLAYFLKEFGNLNQSERIDFSLMIQKNKEDFTERLFYYVSQFNDKRKSEISGKLGVAMARLLIEPTTLMRLIQKIKDSSYEDLIILKIFIEKNGLFRRVQSDEKYEKLFFVSPLSHRFLEMSNSEKNSLLLNGFLSENYNWRDLGRTDDTKKIEGVLNAIRNQKPEYSIPEDVYYLYKFGLMD